MACFPELQVKWAKRCFSVVFGLGSEAAFGVKMVQLDAGNRDF
jgi:hypothetical protein